MAKLDRGFLKYHIEVSLMKVKLSKSQWEEVGKKAGWIKTAGEDWMVSEEHTQSVISELTRRGDEIFSSAGNKVVVNHKVGGKIIKGLMIRVFEGSYEGSYVLNFFNGATSEMLGMSDGQTAYEALDSMDNQLRMIITEINKK